MNVKIPREFHFNEGKKPYVVLLLHGFTGNTSDVRQLGRFLEKYDIPSYSFNYEGHGEAPEKLIKSSPYVWYKQIIDTYDSLSETYDTIHVLGLSIGGVFALQLSLDREVETISTVCSPMTLKSNERLMNHYKVYAREYKKRFENQNDGEIDRVLETFVDTEIFDDIRSFISTVREKLDEIMDPIFIAQGEQDSVIHIGSAKEIYDTVEADDKELKYYKNSGHVLTLDKDRETFFQDYYEFIKKYL